METARVEGKAMGDGDAFVLYTIILARGALSPAEDLETALVAAAQSEVCGEPVCGSNVARRLCSKAITYERRSPATSPGSGRRNRH